MFERFERIRPGRSTSSTATHLPALFVIGRARPLGEFVTPDLPTGVHPMEEQRMKNDVYDFDCTPSKSVFRTLLHLAQVTFHRINKRREVAGLFLNNAREKIHSRAVQKYDLVRILIPALQNNLNALFRQPDGRASRFSIHSERTSLLSSLRPLDAHRTSPLAAEGARSSRLETLGERQRLDLMIGII